MALRTLVRRYYSGEILVNVKYHDLHLLKTMTQEAKRASHLYRSTLFTFSLTDSLGAYDMIVNDSSHFEVSLLDHIYSINSIWRMYVIKVKFPKWKWFLIIIIRYFCWFCNIFFYSQYAIFSCTSRFPYHSRPCCDFFSFFWKTVISFMSFFCSLSFLFC